MKDIENRRLEATVDVKTSGSAEFSGVKNGH
jgi:hypothetical protein